MVKPSKRQAALAICALAWIGIQIFFFLPPGWPDRNFVFILKSEQGNFRLFQSGRHAVLFGAFSDRYQRFPKTELVPFLKQRGIVEIRRLMIAGHDSVQTGALQELQKNFQITELNYPPDSALEMRRTFGRIGPEVGLKRLEDERLFSKLPRLPGTKKASFSLGPRNGFLIDSV